MDVTEDVYLSESQESDSARYVEIFEDGEVSKTLLNVPHPYFEENAIWFINLTKQKRAELGRMWNFAGRSRSQNDQVISGLVVCEPVNNIAEIGYWLAKEHWGKGLMAQIINRVVEYIREQRAAGLGYLDISQLQADIFSHNQNSAKVLIKCGFRFVNHVADRYVKNGITIDGDHYVLDL